LPAYSIRAAFPPFSFLIVISIRGFVDKTTSSGLPDKGAGPDLFAAFANKTIVDMQITKYLT
jgi:hypothetical protein